MQHTKVTLRKRPISNGRYSLYLDFYPPIRDARTFKETRREFLGIYIYQKPKNEIEREYNKEVLKQAEAIRADRVSKFINEKYGFLNKQLMNTSFIDYFKLKATKKQMKWELVIAHFEKFTGGKCAFKDITVDFCVKFREYLQGAMMLKRNEKLHVNSASSYFSIFKEVLKSAYLDKLLTENVNDYLDGIKTINTKREYLTLEEVRMLYNEDCEYDVLKRASLFSCLTGLRKSDILKLTWDEIQDAPTSGYCIRLKTQKTKAEVTIPITPEAFNLCGVRGEGPVFAGLTSQMIYYNLSRWIEKSGIKKRITFHCFRHTYATLLLSTGTDIYTVSKLLTHRNIATTQIYGDIVSEVKTQAVSRIKITQN